MGPLDQRGQAADQHRCGPGEILAALEAVDFVTIFNEPDPYRVMAASSPMLVKGGDWPIEKIIGRDIVQARGGRVVNVPYIDGASTTGIIEKILKIYK
jgi:bifunctional ADP-heptose synthase (sugar kinase/adenylyltransferase)